MPTPEAEKQAIEAAQEAIQASFDDPPITLEIEEIIAAGSDGKLRPDLPRIDKTNVFPVM